MTAKKSHSDKSARSIDDREAVWIKLNEAIDAMRELVRSMKMNAEEKIAVEDGINNLAKEVESMLDRIDMAAARADRKNLLAAYKKFLEHNIEIVNQRLKNIDKG